MRIEDKRRTGICNLSDLEVGDMFELLNEIYILTCKVAVDMCGDIDNDMYECFNITTKETRDVAKLKNVIKRTGTLILD